MSDLTPDKWAELNAKLEDEKADAAVREKAATTKAGKLVLAAIGLVVVVGALLWIFASTSFAVLASMPPGLLFLVCVLYVFRNQKIAAHARDDSDRIQRDIRAWKKKRPTGA